MFRGWTTGDFIAAIAGLWIAANLAAAVFGLFVYDLEQRFGPKARVYDFTSEARRRRAS